MLVYAAILGSSPEDRISLNPARPCMPSLSSRDSLDVLGSIIMGKYTPWFNDVHSTDISCKSEEVLELLSKTHGSKVEEVVIPQLNEMRAAHVVTIGTEMLSSINADYEDGKSTRLTCETRTSMALFRSFTATDYIAAQRLRRRIMYHHMEVFKKVPVITQVFVPNKEVTSHILFSITAPLIPPSAHKYGENDTQVTAYFMQFVIAGNLLGLPAISVPISYDKQGLPIGIQLIGRPWGEATIL